MSENNTIKYENYLKQYLTKSRDIFDIKIVILNCIHIIALYDVYSKYDVYNNVILWKEIKTILNETQISKKDMKFYLRNIKKYIINACEKYGKFTLGPWEIVYVPQENLLCRNCSTINYNCNTCEICNSNRLDYFYDGFLLNLERKSNEFAIYRELSKFSE